jgi:hypothetical protein
MPAYDEDVYAWAFEQARFLREGRFDLLDIEHLADEIENVAKEEVRELIKRMSICRQSEVAVARHGLKHNGSMLLTFWMTLRACAPRLTSSARRR